MEQSENVPLEMRYDQPAYMEIEERDMIVLSAPLLCIGRTATEDQVIPAIICGG